MRSVPLFSGFCYTQFTDTYQEANGLLYMDRTPKFPLEQIAIATRGPDESSGVGSGEGDACADWPEGIRRGGDFGRRHKTGGPSPPEKSGEVIP